MVKQPRYFLQYLILVVVATTFWASSGGAAPAAAAGDRLSLSGAINNPQGKGVKEVEVEILVNGQPVHLEGEEAVATGSQGTFVAEVHLPAGTLPAAEVTVKAHKPCWRSIAPTPVKLIEVGTDQEGNRLFQAHQQFTLYRQITPAFWLATLTLLFVYGIIAAELMHRTLAALLGAALILFISYTAGTFDKSYFILGFEDAMHAIDMNVIFLLMGMMIIVGVLKKTGLFQWLAFKSYAMARGNVFILSCILMVVTAVCSAFLDNVTTMLLMIPVTIEIAITLKINPIAFLIPEVFASNVGGTATLIGDPPNILIGSYAKLSFVDFVMNLTIIVAVCLVISLIYYVYWYKKDYLKAEIKDVGRTIDYLQEEYKITNKKLLTMALGLLSFTIFLFIIHGVLHMEPSIAALTGAMLLLAVSRIDIVEMLEHEVEWPTLIFFMALFMVVAGAEETGLIQVIAEWVAQVSQGSLVVAVLMVLWVSALASAAIDNIPFTATMLPIIAFLNETIPGAESGVLWWALALGACLGGNGTMIGASANVVTVGLAEKAGYPISFLYYMRACFIPMLITIIIASAYLLIFEI
ncbi:MAG: ArsB/NhaD family transporter [Deltaproteobacteria bacterium]|nr:ArsB/NhaD family transporter [Deltaproteobacteria bacterium]MBW1953325.1 ArsB/NhaD family transporter [Deltaproteobacteria bacterium]MBW1987753.1 ArsB/NhaD family transporter [Deltaproteobacteria bacterium]MBW2135853.1 ArsB/NhaD family transporter [Deltaproteobacteria bacterium]